MRDDKVTERIKAPSKLCLDKVGKSYAEFFIS